MGEALGAPRQAELEGGSSSRCEVRARGFRLCRTSALWFGVAEEVLRLTDETRKHFYKGERVYLEGEEVRFPELADTLEASGRLGLGSSTRGSWRARSPPTCSRWAAS